MSGQDSAVALGFDVEGDLSKRAGAELDLGEGPGGDADLGADADVGVKGEASAAVIGQVCFDAAEFDEFERAGIRMGTFDGMIMPRSYGWSGGIEFVAKPEI